MKKVLIQDIELGNSGEISRNTINTNFNKLNNTMSDIDDSVYSLANSVSNIAFGIIPKGDKENEAEIKAIINPKKGDTYKALDTGNYWTFDGSQWNNIGGVIPSDINMKADITTAEGQVIRTLNILKSNYTPDSIFGADELSLIQCISDLSIVDYVSDRRIAINVAGFSTNYGYVVFQFRDVDNLQGFNFHYPDITTKPSGVVHYVCKKDYQVKIEFSFDWDRYQKIYNSEDNLNLIIQSSHVAEQTIYGDSEVAKMVYLNSSKFTDQEIKIRKCIQNLSVIDYTGSTEYRLRTIGWSNNSGYPVFIFMRVSDSKLQQFNESTITTKPTGIKHYDLYNNEISVSFDFDWDFFNKHFSDRYTLDTSRYLAFNSIKTDLINSTLFVSRNFLQNSAVTYDNINIARCFQNLTIIDYEKGKASKYVLLQQGWSNGTGYPIFYFKRLLDDSLEQFNLSEITIKPNGIQYYRLANDNVCITFSFDWDMYNKYFSNRYGGNSGLYVQSIYIEQINPLKQIGSTVTISKGGLLLATGASFKSPANGWLELGCSRLEIRCINKAVGGSNIINNVVDKMMDANDTQPHGSLFMIDKVIKVDGVDKVVRVDGFHEVEVFTIMHTHLWDVYLEKSNTIEYYKEKYTKGEEFTRAEAYDYVILQYQQWCAEYTHTIDLGNGLVDVIGTKNCNILLFTHWHQSRDLYNDSIRKVAVKFGLPLCRFDENIGFSNTDFVTTTLNTDVNIVPTKGIYHRSILYTHYSGVKDGVPIGKTENYKGVTYGWHPQTRSKDDLEYGYPIEADGYYYPYIQYLMCGIFMGCVEVV